MLTFMTRFDVDLFVIGGGSGGVRAGRVAAEHGAESPSRRQDRWGGTCVIRGCVPKKLLVYASEVRRSLEDARGNGWTIEGATHDWAALIAAKDKRDRTALQRVRSSSPKAGAEVIEGRAVLARSPHGRGRGRADHGAHILIATGGRAKRPAPRVDHLRRGVPPAELPKRIAILGGGYIGVEFAHIFAGLGAKVTLVHRDKHVLRGFDPDVRESR